MGENIAAPDVGRSKAKPTGAAKTKRDTASQRQSDSADATTRSQNTENTS